LFAGGEIIYPVEKGSSGKNEVYCGPAGVVWLPAYLGIDVGAAGCKVLLVDDVDRVIES